MSATMILWDGIIGKRARISFHVLLAAFDEHDVGSSVQNAAPMSP
jgi:hypothetical protein